MQTPNELMPDRLQADLLWENASPTSTFERQTIQLDLRKYRFAYIVYRRKAAEGDFIVYYLIIKDGRYYTPSTDYNSDALSLMRPTKVNDDSVTFEIAYVNFTNDNNFMVPEMIYGVR